MNSIIARARVVSGEMTSDEAVDKLCLAGDHGEVRDQFVLCPECGTSFFRTPHEHMNTCSDACQRTRNAAIFELDGGRSIIKVCELTPARLNTLLQASGIIVDSRARKVLPS